MMITGLLLISVVTIAISGVPALALPRRSNAGQWIAAGLNCLGAGLGCAALLVHCFRPEFARPIGIAWALPLGRFAISLDPLSLIFLIPVFFVPALGSIYGLGYWPQRRHPTSARQLPFFWGLLTAAMAMIVLARDGVLFLIAWEVMALAAFFLVVTEDRRRAVREAGWVYLVATHAGTLCLIGFFGLLRQATGSFELWPARAALSPHVATALFILGACGFALKAGLMPLHVWLPGAHANAPSHVSAILSGVMLKMGVYGLVRLAGLMPHPPVWWGTTLLLAGGISALLGIAFAAGQGDLKRLLAYSSIENMGIIAMALGLAALGRSLGRPDWVVLGLAGALLHALNHSLFKPLLFMGAGAIVHATHLRQLDRLGGLGARMPRTFALFLVGALGIAALPPLNGFVSELFVYLGFFRAVATPGTIAWVGLAAPALALVGALALAAFVKLLGAAFAGAARSDAAAGAHEPGTAMLLPMAVLAAGCVLIGTLPVMVTGLLDRAILDWDPALPASLATIGAYVPIAWFPAAALGLLATIAVAAWSFMRLRTNRPARSAGTWDCGYAHPTARMQYGGSSFSQMLVELLAWALWPRRRTPRIAGVFAAPTQFSSEVPDVVLDRALLPAMDAAESSFAWARVIQRGPIQVYLLYVLAILVLLFLFT